MMLEVWKDIPGYENRYQVSNIGNIRSLYFQGKKRVKQLRPTKDKDGYLTFSACINNIRKGLKVHRCVAISFIKNTDNKPCINHINGIKDDNRLENLEWCTQSENVNHALKNKLKIPKSGINHWSIISVDQFNLDGWYINTYISIKEASDKTNSCPGRISRCINNKLKKTNGFIWKEANACQY